MPNIHFDWLARWYDRAIRPSEKEPLHRLLQLPIAGLMLEVGGGTGRVSFPLCDQVGGLVVCDLSLPMLRQAQVKGCLLTVQGRVEHLPFPDAHFERVLVVDAFHHFPDQPAAIPELVRVLEPGGILVIEEPDIRQFGVKMIALMETVALMGSRFRPPAEMAAMFSSAGLPAQWLADDQGGAWVYGVKPG
ncbi:MAG: class I SAM-dependent methyltransferase [Anaerolineae bacterium]|nr:class I SAM-dependent methyltransferase [Anaerolineae bacterium]